jgi:hypothetical protein
VATPEAGLGVLGEHRDLAERELGQGEVGEVDVRPELASTSGRIRSWCSRNASASPKCPKKTSFRPRSSICIRDSDSIASTNPSHGSGRSAACRIEARTSASRSSNRASTSTALSGKRR